MMSEKLEKIKEILHSWYQDKMPEKLLNECAAELYESVFIDEYDLDDIPSIVVSYEERADIEEDEWLWVFIDIVHLLDRGESTARRLYKSFMYDLDVIDTFVLLVIENEEYLSQEELAAAKEKAFQTFDRELLESYGIEE